MECEAQAYGDELRKALASISRGPKDIQPQKAPKRPNFRKLALAHYGSLGQVICVHCGFGIVEVLEVAHIDGNRSNNDLTNLAILCPICHKITTSA
jgi:5-methylcytosine-specific restriction endonuclease McrA